jgi:hypothetical protein
MVHYRSTPGCAYGLRGGERQGNDDGWPRGVRRWAMGTDQRVLPPPRTGARNRGRDRFCGTTSPQPEQPEGRVEGSLAVRQPFVLRRREPSFVRPSPQRTPSPNRFQVQEAARVLSDPNHVGGRVHAMRPYEPTVVRRAGKLVNREEVRRIACGQAVPASG